MGAQRCGVFLPLVGLEWSQLRDRVLRIESLGYDSVWFDDHFWFPDAPERDHLEVWTVLAALAPLTRRLGLGPLVLSQSFRSPSLLAKMAASLSQVAPGRLCVGLGAGWMEEEYRAYGYDLPSARERLGQLGDAVEILRRLWSEERASFAGRHYRVQEAPCLPKPKGVSLLLGGSGERLLRIAARSADAWNSPNPAWRDLPVKLERLRELCRSIGRDPREIEVSEQTVVVVGATEADVVRRLAEARRVLGGFARFDGDVHVGTPEQVADALRARRAQGVDSFMVMFGDFGSAEQIDLFGERVLPLLREPRGFGLRG